MRSVNKVIMVGRVAADPEIRQTPNGTTVGSFPIAINRDWSSATGEKKKAVDFHRIIVWRGLADAAEKYFLKGTAIYLEGRLTNRSYEVNGEKKYITEIVADNVNVLTWKKRPDGSAEVSLTDSAHETQEKEEEAVAA